MDLMKLKSLAIAKEVRRGTILIKEGDQQTPLNMYFILKGSVNVFKNFRQPDEVQLAKLGPGSFVGEMSLFLSAPRSASVVTAEECIVCELTRENTLEIIREQPEFAHGMMVALCERLRAASKKVSAFNMKVYSEGNAPDHKKVDPIQFY